MEKLRLELENLDIIGIVRGMGLTPDQLAEIIKAGMPSGTERKEAVNNEAV